MKEPNKTVRRIWMWVAALTVVACLYPVEDRLTRLAVVAGVVTTWTGAVRLWWRSRLLRSALLLAGMLPVIAVCLPGRTVDPDRLREDYVRSLRSFRGVRYVWGGEGWLGMDCSGLVRKALVLGQIHQGLRTLNGRPIREALWLWWHDGSAAALREGYRDRTVELFRDQSVADADHSRLEPGDLAVTLDGIHVMVYLGRGAWIEADPNARKVVELQLPTDNPWFHVPVVYVRWRCLRMPNTGVDGTGRVGAATGLRVGRDLYDSSDSWSAIRGEGNHE